MEQRLKRHQRDEQGQILIGIIGISLAILLAVATLATTLANTVSSSDHTANQAVASSLALSGANWFFSQLNNDPSWFSNTTPCGACWTDSPANTASTLAGSPWGPNSVDWGYMDPEGQIVACNSSDASQTSFPDGCFQIKATQTAIKAAGPGGNFGGDSNPAGLTNQGLIDLVITTRSNCRGDYTLCQIETYQSQLQRRNFLDYMYFDNHETLAPELYAPYNAAFGTAGYVWSPSCNAQVPNGTCLYPAYQGAGNAADSIGGPVFTNSDHVFICGTVNFSNPYNASYTSHLITAVGDITQPAVKYNGGGCQPDTGSPSAIAESFKQARPLALPSPDDLTTNLQSIAGAFAGTGSMLIYGPGDGTIKFAGTAVPGTLATAVVQLGGTTTTGGFCTSIPSCVQASLPATATLPSGVVYVNGVAAVEGVFNQPMTVVTAPGYNLIVRGNMAPSCGGGTGNFPPPSCNTKLGVIAGNDVVISDVNYLSDSKPTIDGALMALGFPLGTGANPNPTPPPGIPGSTVLTCPVQANLPNLFCGTVYASSWTQAKPVCAGCSPTITISGAIVSQYRGVFGNYDLNSGQLIDGYQKHFQWDPHLLTGQPPYFLQPSAAQWVQTGVQASKTTPDKGIYQCPATHTGC